MERVGTMLISHSWLSNQKKGAIAIAYRTFNSDELFTLQLRSFIREIIVLSKWVQSNCPLDRNVNITNLQCHLHSYWNWRPHVCTIIQSAIAWLFSLALCHIKLSFVQQSLNCLTYFKFADIIGTRLLLLSRVRFIFIQEKASSI